MKKSYLKINVQEILFSSVKYKWIQASNIFNNKSLIVKSEMFTQTVNQKRRTYDCANQTMPIQNNNQACEANYALIKRECIPRNQEE